MTSDSDFACPHCGAELPAGAEFCRHCGASDEAGWNEEEAWEHTLPEDEFDYEAFVEREFPESSGPGGSAASLRRAATLVLVLLICLSILLMTIL